MINLISDSDDEIGDLSGSAAKRLKPNLLLDIHSDDDQPLESLKQELKHRLHASQGGSAPAPAEAAAGVETAVDLDNWSFQALQRRLKRRNSPLQTAGQPPTRSSPAEEPQQQQPAQLHASRKAVAGISSEVCDGQHLFPPDPVCAAATAHAPPRRSQQQAASSSGPVGHADPMNSEGPADSFGTAARGPAAAVPDNAPARGRQRLTAEQREARAAQKAEEKARKAADKIAAKLAKQMQTESARAAKRFENFSRKKANGSLQEYEMVLLMDAATAGSPLGRALAADLDRRKTLTWMVVERLPLTGRWKGCSCFCFKRRKMCEADEHAMKTAVSMQLHEFQEDVSPPHLQLVFEKPEEFLEQLQRDQLADMLQGVAAAQPDCSLGLVVMSLKSCVQKLENQALQQGAVAAADWRRVHAALLELHLTRPGLQLRLLSKLDEAALHIINTARVLGQQPYMEECQLEACGSAGPGAASKAAAAKMQQELGPVSCQFAVNTLGKLHGMGGNKAWAIAKEYPSMGALIAGFEQTTRVSGAAGASLMLADLMEPDSSKARPRRLGPVLSRRLHLMLTCEDPDTIVEGEADPD